MRALATVRQHARRRSVDVCVGGCAGRHLGPAKLLLQVTNGDVLCRAHYFTVSVTSTLMHRVLSRSTAETDMRYKDM